MLLAWVAAWFQTFPLVDELDTVDIAFDSLVLATSACALFWLRSFRHAAFETAWKVLIFSHLICWLDCFTDEPETASAIIAVATYIAETVTITAILWGFHRHQTWRQKQFRRLQRAKLERLRSERRYADLVNSVEGIVWEADPETFRFLFVSKQAERLLGYPVSQWREEEGFWANHIDPADRDWAVAYCRSESQARRSHVFECRMTAADGRTVWVRDLVNCVQNPDGSWRLCGVMVEISETKQLEERLRHSASHDPLTDLPNRNTFLAKLREVHQRSASKADYAVLFLDIDRFKIVNDTLGHHYGDRVIVELARRLSSFVGERGMVARLGGDEFAVLAERLDNAGEAVAVAQRLQSVASQTMRVGGRSLEPSVSVGIALGRPECEDVQELLQDADTAMYRAKAAQRGTSQIFNLEMRRSLLEQVKLEADLKRGLRAGEFGIFLQPIVDLSSGRAEGFESLTRWFHPERGIVEAREFMQFALEIEIGPDLAWNAIDMTFRQAAQWARRLGGGYRLSANVSARQLAQADFLPRTELLLGASGADPRSLVLEITEDVATEESVTERKLFELKRLGFNLALDDFGVGRSSLNRLCRLPIDIIKVDRSFIQRVEEAESAVLVRAISRVAEDLGLEVVAEGVETESQRSRLIELGFRLGQGFLFDRPLPPDEAERRLAERPVHLVAP